MVTQELYAELVKRVEKLETNQQDFQNKIGNLFTEQATVTIQFNYITKMIEELKSSVTELAKQPAKRWESLVNHIISAIVSLVVSGGAIAAVFKYYAHSGG
jgi:uncharacterized protein (UPF0335 family)